MEPVKKRENMSLTKSAGKQVTDEKHDETYKLQARGGKWRNTRALSIHSTKKHWFDFPEISIGE